MDIQPLFHSLICQIRLGINYRYKVRCNNLLARLISIIDDVLIITLLPELPVFYRLYRHRFHQYRYSK